MAFLVGPLNRPGYSARRRTGTTGNGPVGRATYEVPLVSCIMPTYNRRGFVCRAIEYFLRQDYPHRELIVVDDGEDCVADLMVRDPRVSYYRLPARWPLGAKRNFACEKALGELIVHWDDDDWMASQRISFQVEALRRAEADLCGLSTLLFYEPGSGRAWQYRYPRKRVQLVAGGSLCFTRQTWQDSPFAAVDRGEDARFVWDGCARRIVPLDECRLYVAVSHPANTNPRRTDGARWSPYALEKLRTIMGEDFDRYGREMVGRQRSG